MDKILALKTFVRVADAAGFSKAARNLGVATSSATRLIDLLEASLGTALLTRSTRQVALTDAGKTYYEQVTRLLNDLAQADASVSDAGAEPHGSLRVTMPVAYGHMCLGPHVGAFLERYPKIELDVVLTDAITDLVAEHIDVAVRIGSMERDVGLIARQLNSHRRHVVASHEYLTQAGTPARPADLVHHHCLRFAYEPARWVWTFRRGEQLEEVPVHGRLIANNSEILREGALNGAGIALLPHWLVDGDIQSGGLTSVFEDWEVNPNGEDITVYAAYLPNRRNSRKVHAFVDFLLERVVGQPPENVG